MNIKFYISGYVNELVTRLHSEYPHQERSGIGRVEKQDWKYVLTDIRFPKQHNWPATTELTDDWLSLLLEELVVDDPSHLWDYKCWIHSHHSMSCFWSWTDEEAKRSFNDGNTRFRFSVVTAYSWGSVSYLWALNVFNPVNMEVAFTPQVLAITTADRDKIYWENSTTIRKSLLAIEQERDKKIWLLVASGIPKEKDIVEMLDIFNSEDTQENRSAIIAILSEEEQHNIERLKEAYNRECAQSQQELLSSIGNDLVESRIEELKWNIQRHIYTQYSRPFNKGWKKKKKSKSKYTWERGYGERDIVEDNEYPIWDEYYFDGVDYCYKIRGDETWTKYKRDIDKMWYVPIA